MNNHKRHKQRASSRHNHLTQLHSPHQRTHNKHPHHNSDRKELLKPNKKYNNKQQAPRHELSFEESLFQSLQELPITKISKQKNHSMRKKEGKNIVKQQKNEDSTASRDFRQYFKNYNQPNDEYFGSRTSSL